MMLKHMSYFPILLCIFSIQIMRAKSTQPYTSIYRAEVQSCKGCALNRLYEVKNFINHDLPNYKWATFKSIPGAHPDLVLFNKDNKEVERIALASYTRQQCIQLMNKYGKLVSLPRKQDL